MPVRTSSLRRGGATTRRLLTVGAAWAAAGVISLVGCSFVAAPPAYDAARDTATTSPPAPVSPTASTSAPPADSSRLSPVRVRIPALDVDAPLVRLGLTVDGALAVPTKAMTAGWYTGSPVPGRVGPAVIAGHVHWNGIRAVFARLAELTPGDRIVVALSDGSTAAFVVDRVITYPKARFPTDLVYGSLDEPGLRLITCGGFDPVDRAYESNVIVFATLA